MAQQIQEPLTEKRHSRKLRSWVPWTVALVVLGAILVFAITVLFILKSQGINQGTVTLLTILSIMVGTVVALLGLLFTFLQWFHSRPSHLSEPLSPSIAPHHEDVTNNVSLSKSIPINMHQEDWGEAPHIAQFYGREHEQAELKQWMIDDHCRMVSILGIGGVGKTSLTAVVAEQMKDAFDSVFWRSLQNAPPLESILQSCIQFLSHQQQVDLPQDVDSQVTLLIQYLREHRCLVVFDNFDTVLQAGDHVGQYQEGYAGYGRLLQRVGEARHQSCLVLTSREKPKEIAFLEGDLSLVRSRELEGLKSIDGREILKDKGLRGEEKNWESLVLRYQGNPLALKIVAQFIREVFGGDIAGFLKTGEAMFNDIRHVLKHQIDRLSALERELMYWLAIEREAVSLDELDEDLVHSVSRRALLEAIESLRRRSMIEISGVAHFTQQPVIMEYMLDELVGQVYKEIDSGSIGFLANHALIKAQTKDYIRDSQVRLILTSIAERLLGTLSKEEIEKKLKNMLSALRETQPHKAGYAAGNILNLLIHLISDLHSYNFSQLVIWQAYLQGVTLTDVNFAYAQFERSEFTETFGDALSVVFSPDGQLLAAGTDTGEIWIWQILVRKPLLILQGHTDWVRSVTFSPDGCILASCGDDQNVRLWDVSTGQCFQTLQGHMHWVRSIAFSPDGTMLASGSDDQNVRLWDVSTGQCLQTLQGHTDWVRSVAFSPDGCIVASGSQDQSVRLWQVSTGQCLQTLLGHTDWVRSIAFSPDGRVLSSCSNDKTIRLWQVSTSQCFQTLQGHTHWVRSIAFSPDGTMLASGSDDQSVRLWDVSTGQCFKILQGHTHWIRAVTFSPDGKILASSSQDQSVRLWQVSTGQCFQTLQGHTRWVRAVAFSPDGTMLASCGDDQSVRLWDVSTGQCLHILSGHTHWLHSIAFSPDGTILISGSEDQTPRLWQVSTGQCFKILQGHTSWIWSVAFSPDERTVASGSEDQTVRLWDVNTGQCLQILQGHNKRVYALAFNPKGNIIVSGSDDQTIRLWDVGTGQCLKILHGHIGQIWSVAVSLDGKTIASGSDDHTIRLWDVSTGQCFKILHGHSHLVRSVAFNPDGKALVSGSDDQTLRLWDISTGQCLKTLQGHSGWVYSVTFSPDGTTIASGSRDGTIRLWDVQSGECFRTLRIDRPYERMNITGVRGLTEAQKATLRALGAVEVIQDNYQH